MAHFTRTRSVWSPNTNLLASEMDDLDTKIFKAANFDEGGTWAPTSVVTIGGAGLTLTTPANFADIHVHGTSLFDSNVTFNGTDVQFLFSSLEVIGATALFTGDTTVTGTATFTNNVTIDTGGALFTCKIPTTFTAAVVLDTLSTSFTNHGASTFIGATAFQSNSNVFNGNMAANGSATFNGNVTLGSDAADTLLVNAVSTFGANAAFNNNLGVSGIFHAYSSFLADGFSTFSGPIQFASIGRVVQRVASAPNSDATYAPASVQVVHIPVGNTAVHTYTIDDTNAINGDTIRFFNNTIGTTHNIATPSVTETIAPAKFREYTRIGGVWLVTATNS